MDVPPDEHQGHLVRAERFFSLQQDVIEVVYVMIEFLPETGDANPFLHLAMHLSLQEQISTDRPTGITALYQQLTRLTGDPHTADHQLMECLGVMLWEAQRNHALPDESAYLECVRGLFKPHRNRSGSEDTSSQ